MSRSILVTGGLGFLGASLTRALVKRGDRVRVLDNVSRGSLEKLGEQASDVEVLQGDIRNPSIVDAAVQGMDCVCHLAFVNGTEFFYKYPAYILDVGVKGMVNVVDACMRHSVGDFVLASSSEVYQTPPVVPTPEEVPLSVPDPLNPRYSYGGGKIISELMAINYGREFFKRMVIFRPHNVYGPAMGFEHVIPQFICRMKELPNEKKSVKFPIQGDGTQTRSFIYIDDFTNALLSILDRGKHMHIYHIGTTEEVTIKQLAMHIAFLMQMEIDVIAGPHAEGGTQRRCPDIRKLSGLGFVPQYPLREGLVPTIQWYRDRKPPLSALKPLHVFPLPLYE